MQLYVPSRLSLASSSAPTVRYTNGTVPPPSWPSPACSRPAQVDGCPHTKVARNIELFSEASDGSQVTEVGKELHFVGCTSCYETWGRMATAIPHSPRLGQVNYSIKREYTLTNSCSGPNPSPLTTLWRKENASYAFIKGVMSIRRHHEKAL
jgi:hypothetical protein